MIILRDGLIERDFGMATKGTILILMQNKQYKRFISKHKTQNAFFVTNGHSFDKT